LLLSAPRAGDVDRKEAPALSSNGTRRACIWHQQQGAAARRSAANAGSVMLTAEVYKAEHRFVCLQNWSALTSFQQ